MHLAAAKVFPTLPRASQLHGTEIKMLENLSRLGAKIGREAPDQVLWRGVLSEAAQSSNGFFAISPDVRERGMAQFGIEGPDITVIPNGVDVSLFRPRPWTESRKMAFLRKILVDEPKGWDESGMPGSARYSELDLERVRHTPNRLKSLFLLVGRFLDFKRVPLLVEAVAEANRRYSTDPPFNLLIWGGMPGEWEGQYPYSLARELDLPNVFFAGWLPHDLLAKGLNLADVFVAPSYFEPFGQVFLEAMATSLPVIATRSGGPTSFVVDSGPAANGWFVEIDDVDSLALTLYQALTESAEAKRRGENALMLIRQEYSWVGIAQHYVSAYSQLIDL